MPPSIAAYASLKTKWLASLVELESHAARCVQGVRAAAALAVASALAACLW